VRLGLETISSFFHALQKQALGTRRLNYLYKQRLRDLNAKYRNAALELHLCHLQLRELRQEFQSATTVVRGPSQTVGAIDKVGEGSDDTGIEVCTLKYAPKGKGRHNAGGEMQFT
jgi:hypothetical protein